MLSKGDLAEAHHIFVNGFHGPFHGATPGGRAALCLFWATGRWSSARQLFRTLPEEAWSIAQQERTPLLASVILEIRAEIGFDQLVEDLRNDPSFFDQALRIVRTTSKTRLSAGALDMAFLAARPEQIMGGESFETSVGGALGLRNPRHTEMALADARRVASRFDLPPNPEADRFIGPSEELARLNPIARPLGAWAEHWTGPAFKEILERMAGSLAHLPSPQTDHVHLGGWTNRVGSNPLESLELLAALGLTSDWAGAVAMLRRLPHLPMLAGAAERWRRTMAGDWAYGRNRPDAWREAEAGIDPGLRLWIDRMTQAPEGLVSAARRYLEFWSSVSGRYPAWSAPSGPSALHERIFRAWVAAERDSDAPREYAAARNLQRAGVPRSLAAPWAALLGIGMHPSAVLEGDW
jgi:hypothetical protein